MRKYLLLTTHDMGDVGALCGQLILIDKGSVLFDGATRDFKRRHTERFSITLTFGAFPARREDARFAAPLVSEEDRTWTVPPCKFECQGRATAPHRTLRPRQRGDPGTAH